ncbi:EF-P 5-aminopentanol modification-associated protein YfmH [Fructobacillus ficulneus]|uniref:Peptidase M16 inactive domain protein n=1 Tax=Fructobacillus ficulneus TaxID=157463 RepID=A0A0K8MJH1_9LACO|nr:pitrilysin family protein [Fructobacillus ficulneus]GAP00010.1 peptidase M16 inactive domain protein [Fructobacillus ficulneus]
MKKEESKSVYRFQTTTGLAVNLIQKPGYHQFLGALTARFGALTTEFKIGSGQKIDIPAGTAHFMEHKVFDKKEGDALVKFTNLGADANAFTGSKQTTYYFTATSQVEESLSWLLTFVQEPYFDQEKVDRERGIIEEEINLYQDDPLWQLYQGILNLLYPGSALSQDIAGSSASLKKISADLLYQIQSAFYQPKNLQLTVVGNFKTSDIAALIEKTEAKVAGSPQTVIVPEEKLSPQVVFDQRKNFPVSVTKGVYGLRLAENSPELTDLERVREVLLADLCLDLVFGDQTDWFQDQYAAGIFGDDFDYEYNSLNQYQYLALFADGDNQDQVYSVLKARFEEAETVLLQSQDDFERIQKAVAGQNLASQNVPDRLGLDEDLALYGLSLFDKMKLITGFCLDDVVECGHHLFKSGRLTRLVLEK